MILKYLYAVLGLVSLIGFDPWFGELMILVDT